MVHYYYGVGAAPLRQCATLWALSQALCVCMCVYAVVVHIIILPRRAVGRDFNINNAINLKPCIYGVCECVRCLHCTGEIEWGRTAKTFWVSFICNPLARGCAVCGGFRGAAGREPDRTIAAMTSAGGECGAMTHYPGVWSKQPWRKLKGNKKQ
jgi:hypothetical protein